ncbi:MAG: S1 family peptidase [Bacteroides sp.]|nr:S1 family peptidase [Bacteroides sp.]
MILFFISCNERSTRDNLQKEELDFIEQEAKSLNVTNNFLNSLSSFATRNADEIIYPSYYGGHYISNERKPVFLVVKGMSEIAQADIAKRADSDFFTIEEISNSYNDLNKVMYDLNKVFLDPIMIDKVMSLGWAGHYISTKENIVYVELVDYSKVSIERFKSEILSSPLIQFKPGEIIELEDNKNDEKSKSTRAAYNLYLGGSFWTSGFGEGSIGYRATDGSAKGFVTCGHAAVLGTQAKLTQYGSTIGVCINSICGGVDAAFVELFSDFPLSWDTSSMYHLIVKSIQTLSVGDYVQKDGAATRWTQGNISGIGRSITFTHPLGYNYTCANVSVANYRSAVGDSGGIIYSLTKYLVGIHVGASKTDATKHYFLPAKNVNTALGVTIY